MTKPDSFFPKIDIMKGESYCIWLDLPGFDEGDIKLKRQNVHTIVNGTRHKILDQEEYKNYEIEKMERKFGEFTIRFKIPDKYERKWNFVQLKNGVLCIKFRKDESEKDIHNFNI